MKFTLKEIEKALVEERITLDQFIEILVDNFGAKKTRKILRHNLALALQKELKNIEPFECKTALHQ